MRVIFCNELGEGTGHFAPYLSLLDALAQRGWQVSIAARNPAEAAPASHQRGFTLFQAPISTTAFAGLDSASFSYTEILHHFGYAHEGTRRSRSASPCWPWAPASTAPRLSIRCP
jgi:hypothetical protein